MTKIKTIQKEKLDKKTKKEIIVETSKFIVERYVFPDVAKKIQNHLLSKLSEGEFDKLSDIQSLAFRITEIIRDISKDGHFQLIFDPTALERIITDRDQNDEEKERIKQERIDLERQANFGFQKLEILEGNIGFFDLRQFCHPDYAADMAIAAMNFLSNTDAIIIDLRKNGGGEPEMVLLLASYFFDKRTQWNAIDRPSEKLIEQFWTLPHVPGKKMVDVDLYVLTSNRTFSGAEDFSYGMKCLKRATLIGETTGGGAHPIDFFSIQDLLVLRLPTARSINPYSKTNWEGTGVDPDITIPSDQAFDVAYVLALETIMQRTKEKDKKLFLEYALAEFNFTKTPFKADKEILSDYQGNYGGSTVTFDGLDLYYNSNRLNNAKLIPLSDTMFAFEEKDLATVGIHFKKTKNKKEMNFLYKIEREIFKKICLE